MLFRHLAASAALMLCTTAAFSQQNAPREGFYLGVDAGQATIDLFSAEGLSLVERGDDTSTSYKFRVGYRFSRYFTLETGYADLGDFSSELFIPCPPVIGLDCSFDVDTAIDGAFINAIGTLPLGEHVYLSATLGGFYRQVESTTVIGSAAPERATDSGTVAQYGVGIGFPLNDRFEITVDVMRTGEIGFSYASAPSFDTTGGEFTVISAGARFIF
jgi:OOP family OmpA-OmpF porin